ncbi:MAG: MFS transporter [Puniceicoccales bacterium]|nr:MFS transporter [Puniceicoccales bacterium]
MLVKSYYGWVLLVIVTLMEALSSLGRTSAFSPFLEQLGKDLQVSQNTISAAYTLANLTAGLLLPCIGKLFDGLPGCLFSSLLVVTFGTLFIILGYCREVAIFLGVSYPWILWMGFSGIRTCIRGFEVLDRAMVAIWFDKQRKWATSLACLILAVIASAIPWIVYKLNQYYTWQALWMVQGGCFILFLLPFCLFIKKKHIPMPKQHLCPAEGRNFNFLKTYAFWIFTAILFLQALQNTGLAFHLVPICKALKVNPEIILKSIMGISALSIIISFVASDFFDRWGPKQLFACFCLSNLLCGVSVLFLSHQLSRYAFIVVCGFSWGMNHSLMYMTWPYVFGTRNIGTINGFVSAFVCLGSSLGPLFFSHLKSLYSYQCVFYILCFVTSLALMGIKRITVERYT